MVRAVGYDESDLGVRAGRVLTTRHYAPDHPDSGPPDQTHSFVVATSRWSLPAQKPLLFVEIVWRNKNGAATFGANAVVEEGADLSILDFAPVSSKEGPPDKDQIPNFADYEPAFLNAWAIGNRRFVLRFTRFYEGYVAELLELVPGRGLVPTWLSYAPPGG